MPTTTETPHGFLRRETERWHAAVERAFEGCDLQTRAGLGAFLVAQAAAVIPVELELDRQHVEDLIPDWSSRRRSTALRTDLARLGCDMPAASLAPRLDTPGRQLGAIYVLEGSRLGGSMLAREAGRSLDPAVRQATAFLAHDPGPRTWTKFRAALNAAEADPGELLAGAEQTFACFLDAAEALSKVKPNVG